jgi:hypothetical protein
MHSRHVFCALALATTVGACTTVPYGPSVAALPGTGKTLEQFQLEDTQCQRYAGTQATRPPAAGVSADPYDVQRRYDFSYIQCMYSNGHKVPVAGAYTTPPAGQIPPGGFIPPPQQNSPPPAPTK